ncbi:hypothetical protein [Paraburkholderia sp. BCC1884]|uniref:hypothetical protein n=1 Tax=Paraburkholderia sp. BCC1884 TaxID=2562668 RepID=UPI001183E3CE|nr:hypothetical protein [Paraburkholderia sp. BCC1884]
MQFDKQQDRLGQSGATMRPGSQSLLAKVLAIVIGAALLVVGFAVSLVMLAVVLGAGIVIGGFVWWKTRDLRKHLREQAMRAQQTHGQQVRERPGQSMDIGDVVEDVEFHDESPRK